MGQTQTVNTLMFEMFVLEKKKIIVKNTQTEEKCT